MLNIKSIAIGPIGHSITLELSDYGTIKERA